MVAAGCHKCCHYILTCWNILWNINHHVWSLFWDLGQCQTFADLDSLRDKNPSARGSLTWKWSRRAWNDRCYSLSGTQLLLQQAAEVTGLSVRVSLHWSEPVSQSCSPALHFMPLVFCRLCILAGESTCKKCCTIKKMIFQTRMETDRSQRLPCTFLVRWELCRMNRWR